MQDNIVSTEILYTYDAAINRYERERHHIWLCNQKKLKKIRQEQRARRKYFCNQKFYGLLLTLLSLLILFLTQELFLITGIAAGVALMTTKKMLIVNDYYWTHGGAEQWKEWVPGLFEK